MRKFQRTPNIPYSLRQKLATLEAAGSPGPPTAAGDATQAASSAPTVRNASAPPALPVATATPSPSTMVAQQYATETSSPPAPFAPTPAVAIDQSTDSALPAPSVRIVCIIRTGELEFDGRCLTAQPLVYKTTLAG